jgi:hypothetical protein
MAFGDERERIFRKPIRAPGLGDPYLVPYPKGTQFPVLKVGNDKTTKIFEQ